MNKNLWISTESKRMRRVKKLDELKRIKTIVLVIKSMNKKRLVYVNRKGR